MKNYQLVLVLKSTLSDENRKKFLETVKSWIKGAKFTKEEDWGKKALAFPIKRETAGVYQNFLFELKEELPQDLEKKINASENVLRHLLLRA